MPSNIPQIDILHTQQLAAELLGIDIEEDTYDIDAELSKKYNIDLEGFHVLAKDLVPFCFAADTPNNTPTQGFAAIDRASEKMSWVIQQPIYNNQDKAS